SNCKPWRSALKHAPSHVVCSTLMRFLPLIAFAFSLLLGAGAARGDEGTDFFEKKVRPLLVEHCLECHGPEKHKGGLRWDSREGWQTGGDSGSPIVPGKPEASLMIKAVSYADRDLKMPPDQKLEPADVAVLKQWIELGAPDPRSGPAAGHAKAVLTAAAASAATHWAYQLPKRITPPVVKDTAWPRNDIDRYVLATLEAKGLRPAPDANPEVLQRRLAHDLTGLPTINTMPAESLLASQAFAERWAQHWLDAARFAESSGGGRTLPFKDAWRYRDYVIESIHHDVPMDRFITEQLAGDLLPYDNAAQRSRQLIATGFLVLGANNYEEQDKDLLRMDIVDEQLDVIGKSLLGLSIGCARCHDHKFDPIPTRDYYAMAGILRSTKLIRNPKENVAHWIDTPLPLEGKAEEEMKAQEAKAVAMQAQLDEAKGALKKMGAGKVAKGKSRSLPLDKVPGIVVDETEARKVGDWKTSKSVPPYIGEGYVHDANEDKGTKTLTFSPHIPRTARYEVRFAYTSLVDRATNVPVKILHADGEEEIKVDEVQPPPIANHYVSLGKFRFEADGQGFVLVSNEGTKGVVTADAVVFIPEDELAKVTEAESATVSRDPKMAKMEKQVSKLTQSMKELEKTGMKRPEAMTVAEHEDLGDCPVHIRGQIRNLGPKVPRGYIQAAFHGEPPKVPAEVSGRVQLAQWMTSRGNTLTARVLANRVWMELFGEGLVRTPDNFGVTGEKPSHPELLDHLAFKLMDEGWSLKKLVSYIVGSHAYAMSSRDEGEGKNTDPENRLLWRQNRKRMDADALRDTMLAAAGTLDLTFMGPNIGNAKAVDGNDGAAAKLEYDYVYT
ncbi:MAG: Protein of unknown function (DUF1553)/Protein of unknown function (DUF1549)/Planctomycete, partial [Verrucomicrobiaceae bacterium]|nr:Protein of unknown function (DUF1553)/Protein of unknown function (DUF1549)/Planctomycete [Verrucomicrobiaceae bacterium]